MYCFSPTSCLFQQFIMMPEAALLKGYGQNSVCLEKIYYLVAVLFLKEYGSPGRIAESRSAKTHTGD